MGYMTKRMKRAACVSILVSISGVWLTGRSLAVLGLRQSLAHAIVGVAVTGSVIFCLLMIGGRRDGGNL